MWTLLENPGILWTGTTAPRGVPVGGAARRANRFADLGRCFDHADASKLRARDNFATTARLLPPEMNEDATKVVGILLDPVVERLDVLAVEEAEYPLLQLARALARDDLH